MSPGAGGDGVLGGKEGKGGSWTGRSKLDALSKADGWAPDLKRTLQCH